MDPATLDGMELVEYMTLFLENLVPVRSVTNTFSLFLSHTFVCMYIQYHAMCCSN